MNGSRESGFRLKVCDDDCCTAGSCCRRHVEPNGPTANRTRVLTEPGGGDRTQNPLRLRVKLYSQAFGSPSVL